MGSFRDLLGASFIFPVLAPAGVAPSVRTAPIAHVIFTRPFADEKVIAPESGLTTADIAPETSPRIIVTEI